MSVVSSTVPVTDVRVALPVPPSADFSAGSFLELTNADPANAVRIGGDDITFVSGGTLVPAGGTWFSQGQLHTGDDVYAICGTGLTASLNVLWTRV